MEIEGFALADVQIEKGLKADGSMNVDAIAGPVHFIGIGGIGMSALARLLLKRGKKVSGSDRQKGEMTDELSLLGARIFIGHKEENVEEARSVVVSTAIVNENPELEKARQLNLPIFHRSDILAALSAGSKTIAVTGTHGKTTTTGMIAQVLIEGGLDPSVVIGGMFDAIKSNSRHGEGGYFVAEADESDGTHLSLASEIAVITNIEPDHLENYPGGLDQIYDMMAEFASKARSKVIICADDRGCRAVLDRIERPLITYGAHKKNEPFDYSLDSNWECPDQGAAAYEVRILKRGAEFGTINLKVPGEHNKLNALAAVAAGSELNIPFDAIKRALESFGGVDRRFQIIGEEREIVVVDDYAHHPTEVVATLKAAQQFLRKKAGRHEVEPRVVAIFQPHQPGRLRDLWDDFVAAFDEADLVLMLDVYVARGAAIEGVDSRKLVECIKHGDIHYLPGTINDVASRVVSYLKPGDLVLTIGAGDVTNLGGRILELLRQGTGN